jgi:hypothetical protein
MAVDSSMTVEQIVSAIRALPVAERLRVIELVAHEAANDVPVTEAAPSHGATLTEQHGLLIVDADDSIPAEAFDHRLDRDARANRIWGAGS